MNIYILAAGKSKKGELPNGLKNIPTGESVLDWQLKTFKSSSLFSKIFLVAGYKYETFLKKHPNLNLLINPNWEKTSPINIFKNLPNVNEVIFTYGDTLFKEDFIKSIIKEKSDIIIVFDSFWEKRFSKRSKEDKDIAETFFYKILKK